ncbi:hypothetical protein V565_152560 [Rhizoctonia solani 123E]|uniref:Uncharacterized protein n=1 Tax=Rhizoctonia solani 123E TaxID=1423351 RepID=A0A074RS47_9AGAM|nr:hypothetical protein V565_152560 [Rhizoctonia solani 123E]
MIDLAAIRSMRLRPPMGRLSECTHIDPREIELNKLREVAEDMGREVEEAKERLAHAEAGYADFIKAIETTYKGEAEAIAWFSEIRISERQVDRAAELEAKKVAFKDKEHRYLAEKEDIRRMIRVYDQKIQELNSKEVN